MKMSEFKERILKDLEENSTSKDQWLAVYFSGDEDEYYGESSEFDKWDVLMIIMKLIENFGLNPVAIAAMYESHIGMEGFYGK